MTEEAADLEVGADDAVRNIQVDRLIGLDPVEIRDILSRSRLIGLIQWIQGSKFDMPSEISRLIG